MGHSQAEKAKSRERILTAAANQIREGGLESVSVGKLMRTVNLTHGGFYNHFSSRSELISEALKRAMADSQAVARTRAGESLSAGSFAAYVRGYLSRTHRDSRDTGCAIAALVSDVGRADEALRSAMEDQIENFIARLARDLGEDDDASAIVAVCAMVGALGISRVLTDPKRSDAILKTVRQHVTRMAEE